jgi:ATP-dependent DNA helicase RecG
MRSKLGSFGCRCQTTINREAFVNSLVHRDYTRLGAVHVRLENDGLTISNPGGFVEGVNLGNLLVSEPRPRNPLLADIVKRIGLAERTGRGIDLIYEGLLRFGRPALDYSRSDAVSVILRMSNAAADKDFLRLILQEEEKLGRTLPLDSLIILSRLRTERRMNTAALAENTQRGEAETRASLEKLVESGLVEAHGTGRGRAYTLSSGVYQTTGETVGYIRQAGFKPIQHEQMILNYIEKNGRIKREEVMELCMLTKDQAAKLLKRLKENNKIVQSGERRGSYYILQQ